MHNYKELKIWSKAIDISLIVYQLVNNFPESEKFNLSSQIRRSAISIPSNIAEGAGRNSDKEFIRFLSIAKGSCYELQTQILISHKLNFITDEDNKTINASIDEIEKMIRGFQTKLKSNV